MTPRQRGLDTICYAVLRVPPPRDDHPPPVNRPKEPPGGATASRLRRARTTLLEAGAFVDHVLETGELWAFSQSVDDLDAVLPSTGDRPAIDALADLYIADRGAVRTADLLAQANGMLSNTNLHGFKQSLPTPTGVARPEEKANKIYHLFMRAVEKALLYRLCSSHGCLPHPSGCLLMPAADLDLDCASPIGDQTVESLNISLTLTKHGSLFVAGASVVDVNLTPLKSLDPAREILLLPQGLRAYLGAPDTRLALAGRARLAWRQAVITSLREQTIHCVKPDEGVQWVPVSFSQRAHAALEWPRCFCLDVLAGRDRTPARRKSSLDGLDGDQIHDPISLALHLLKDFEQEALTETDGTPKPGGASVDGDLGLLGGALFPFSPDSARPAASQDLPYPHSAVYPTPPDGFQLGAQSDVETGDALPDFDVDSQLLIPDSLQDEADTQGDFVMREASMELSNVDDLFGDEQDAFADQSAAINADFDLFSETLPGGRTLLSPDINMETDNTWQGSAHDGTKEQKPALDSDGNPSRRGDGPQPDAALAPPMLHIDLQRPAPPMVRKASLLSPILEDGSGVRPGDEARQFHPVQFHREVSQSDSKYASGGRFFGSMSLTPRRESSHLRESRSGPGTKAKLLSKPRGETSREDVVASKQRRVRSRAVASRSSSDASDSSEQSDEDEIQHDVRSSESEDTGSSVEDQIRPLRDTTQKTVGGHEAQGLPLQPALQEVALADKLLRSLSSLPAHIHSTPLPYPKTVYGRTVAPFDSTRLQQVGPEDLMNIAQLLVDHSAFSYSDAWRVRRPTHDSHLMSNGREALRRSIVSAIDKTFRQASPIEDVDALAIVDPTPILSSPRLQGLGSNGPSSGQLETIFVLAPPAIEVMRNHSRWALSALGACFWETMGLSPANGPKHLVAHCMMQSGTFLPIAATDFLGSMQMAYHNGRFGRHQVGGLLDEAPGGIIATDDLADACHRFGQRFKQAAVKEPCAQVIYLIDPLSMTDPSLEILRCALALRRAFDMTESDVDSALCIKIVPMDLVALRSDGLVPEPKDSFLRAQEIYDRIGVMTESTRSSSTELPVYVAPSIELEDSPIAKVPLHIVENPSSNPLMEGSCLHLAYARSSDQKWISVVWMDSRGKSKSKAAYAWKGHSFPEIAIEIWAATLEIVRPTKFRWRLIVVAVDGTKKHEISTWLRLAERSQAWLDLTLMTANLASSLRVRPPAAGGDALQALNPLAATTALTTPTSTPKPSQNLTSSPAAPTPPAATGGVSTPMSDAAASLLPPDADSSARLVDVTDQSWGVVLSHSINVCVQQPVFIPSLVSGYLAKRTGPSEQDAPTFLELSLVHCGEDIAAGESAMARDNRAFREVLSAYRNLSLLAKLRGMADETSTVPLHILAAQRGAESLVALSSAL